MSDLVERLRGTREWVGFPAIPICAEAADQIERLRASFHWIVEYAETLEGAKECARRVLAGEQEKMG